MASGPYVRPTVRVDTGSVITDTLGGVTVVSYVYTAAAGCTESKAERADNGKPAPSKTYTLPSLSANVHPFLASPDNTPSSPGGGRNPPRPGRQVRVRRPITIGEHHRPRRRRRRLRIPATTTGQRQRPPRRQHRQPRGQPRRGQPLRTATRVLDVQRDTARTTLVVVLDLDPDRHPRSQLIPGPVHRDRRSPMSCPIHIHRGTHIHFLPRRRQTNPDPVITRHPKGIRPGSQPHRNRQIPRPPDQELVFR